MGEKNENLRGKGKDWIRAMNYISGFFIELTLFVMISGCTSSFQTIEHVEGRFAYNTYYNDKHNITITFNDIRGWEFATPEHSLSRGGVLPTPFFSAFNRLKLMGVSISADSGPKTMSLEDRVTGLKLKKIKQHGRKDDKEVSTEKVTVKGKEIILWVVSYIKENRIYVSTSGFIKKGSKLYVIEIWTVERFYNSNKTIIQNIIYTFDFIKSEE